MKGKYRVIYVSGEYTREWFSNQDLDLLTPTDGYYTFEAVVPDTEQIQNVRVPLDKTIIEQVV